MHKKTKKKCPTILNFSNFSEKKKNSLIRSCLCEACWISVCVRFFQGHCCLSTTHTLTVNNSARVCVCVCVCVRTWGLALLTLTHADMRAELFNTSCPLPPPPHHTFIARPVVLMRLRPQITLVMIVLQLNMRSHTETDSHDQKQSWVQMQTHRSFVWMQLKTLLVPGVTVQMHRKACVTGGG